MQTRTMIPALFLVLVCGAGGKWEWENSHKSSRRVGGPGLQIPVGRVPSRGGSFVEKRRSRRLYFTASNVPRPVVWFTMTAADRFSPSGGFLNVALPDSVGTLSIVLRA